MRREITGEYRITAAGGAQVRAFVPSALPPVPPLDLSGELGMQLERASRALGALDAVSGVLPDAQVFLYSYVRKEAVLSSQIEGTQSSLSDLLLIELDAATGVPFDDVVEASNYVAALDHGLARLREGFPLSNRLLREMHGLLLARGRGASQSPGEFRRTQNWIGGSRPGDARFVPAPPDAVPILMSDLERFLHDDPVPTPPILKAALAHVQFETIHPFLDGNGRMGRLLVPMLLHVSGVLREPLLYLSLYLKQHRTRYYELLDSVRTTGDWEAWLSFFATGVEETANGAVLTAQRLSALAAADRMQVMTLGRVAGSALRVHHALLTRPVSDIARLAAATGLSLPGVRSALRGLTGIGLVREVTGRKRGRAFAYTGYLALLHAGTEPG
jgi:Fic family protein